MFGMKIIFLQDRTRLRNTTLYFRSTNAHDFIDFTAVIMYSIAISAYHTSTALPGGGRACHTALSYNTVMLLYHTANAYTCMHIMQHAHTVLRQFGADNSSRAIQYRPTLLYSI